jgi:small redox-active disulfide protein 2
MAELTEEAAKQSGADYTLEKVTDITKIIELGVMITPALLVDGKLKCSGNLPSVEQIVKMLTE